MEIISSGFELLSFHDTSIDSVVREPRVVTIEFSGAFLSKVHPAACGINWHIELGTLILSGVTGEEALFWYGDRVSKPHPKPDLPLDEIMNASFDGKRFAFDGFVNNEPWYEWLVEADAFSLMPRKVKRSNFGLTGRG